MFPLSWFSLPGWSVCLEVDYALDSLVISLNDIISRMISISTRRRRQTHRKCKIFVLFKMKLFGKLKNNTDTFDINMSCKLFNILKKFWHVFFTCEIVVVVFFKASVRKILMKNISDFQWSIPCTYTEIENVLLNLIQCIIKIWIYICDIVTVGF